MVASLMTRSPLTAAGLGAAPDTPPAQSAGTFYSQERGEIVAFGRPTSVAADDGAGESQRGRGHHGVLLCAKGGRRYQLTDQHAAEPGRPQAVRPLGADG